MRVADGVVTNQGQIKAKSSGGNFLLSSGNPGVQHLTPGPKLTLSRLLDQICQFDKRNT
jgi:hypothetical protein